MSEPTLKRAIDRLLDAIEAHQAMPDFDGTADTSALRLQIKRELRAAMRAARYARSDLDEPKETN